MTMTTLVPPQVRARTEDRDLISAQGRSITAGFAPSPLGKLMLADVDGALCRVGYADHAEDEMWRRFAGRWPGARVTRDDGWAQREADRLFSGDADSVEVLLRGTPFQLAVWQALLDVSAGTTESYGELARRVSKPGASRAVGGALNANPVAWLVPCHRVVGGDGGLCGYGGGLNRKQRLLAAEGVRAA